MKNSFLIMPILLTSACVSNQPNSSESKLLPLDQTLEYISESFKGPCTEQHLKVAKLPQEECNLKSLEVLKQCQKITVEGMDTQITNDQVGILLGRMTICNTALLGGSSYSNEKTDNFFSKK